MFILSGVRARNNVRLYLQAVFAKRNTKSKKTEFVNVVIYDKFLR